MKIVLLSFAFFLIPSQVGAASSGREVNNDLLDGRRLHELSELEVDKLLVEKRAVGSLADRAVFFARMGIDQPVGLYVTGEFPFELIDAKPLYNLRETDCLVFIEHCFALAMSDEWKTFIRNLVRVRYKEGAIGVMTRNHFTEIDWIKENAWAFSNVSALICQGDASRYNFKVDRAAFFKRRFNIQISSGVESADVDFVPLSRLLLVLADLKAGDVIGFVSSLVFPGTSGVRPRFPVGGISHLALVSKVDSKGVQIIHASKPVVRVENLLDYIGEREVRFEQDDVAPKAAIIGVVVLRSKVAR